MTKKLNSVKLVTLVDIRDDYREHLPFWWIYLKDVWSSKKEEENKPRNIVSLLFPEKMNCEQKTKC
jgi:hypothetical protein